MTKTQVDQRVEKLLAQLTRKEKISLLSGKDIWNTVPIERLGIPSIVMTDGPHGVRAANPEAGRTVGPTTAFPTGISMGACWDMELIERVGQALGEETRAMDCDILLGPCVNIVRDPRGGRNFETFSEDPYLTGRTAVAYIKGVQSQGVGTSLKHYAVNNYEIERFRASSEIDERTLREIYLSHFEMAVKETQPWTVMCSYNRINGVYASEHEYLLRTILKGEWGFEGAVISDWGAVHNIYEPVKNGLDLEMPGPAKYFKLMADAAHVWQIDEVEIDEAARRVLRLVILSGRMDGGHLDGTTSQGSVNTPEHQALARQLAESAITLLKNEGGVLPLDTRKLQSVAIIGPNATDAVIEGGGSSHVEPPYRVSPLQAIRTRLGDQLEILHAQGCDNYNEPFTVPNGWIQDGMQVKGYLERDFSGKALLDMNLQQPDMWWHTAWVDMPKPPVAVKGVGKLSVPEDGLYWFVLYHAGQVSILLDGEPLINSEDEQPFNRAHPDYIQIKRPLKAGHAYDLTIEYQRPLEEEIFFFKLGLGRTYEAGKNPRLAQAIEAAKNSEVVVVFAGLPEAFESEGRDRKDIDLPGGQNELIAAVAAANPNTVVVLNVGAPVTMPWADDVAAIVLAYYPGLENGNAVTSVLTGAVNPSGKLPITLPKALKDSPVYINASFDGARKVHYGEGIFLGYRYFDEKRVEPLFPFGHGLSYTTFEYSDLKVEQDPELTVQLTVKNTGPLAGKEVVQIYVADPVSSLPRPPKELKAFAKVELQPGESKSVNFKLNQRALSFFDPRKMAWIAEPGNFEILAGRSSRDIRLKASFGLV
jgi:beta-glucosidase